MEQKTEASKAVDELLPCPMCGNEPELCDMAGWEVVCKCGINLCLAAPDKGPLIAAWNRRAALKAQPAPTEAQGEDTRSAVVLAALMDAPRDIAARATTTPQGNMAQGEDSARLDWKRITAPGQVKVGDKLRFTIGDEKFSERVKQIINPGYPDEELIYNKRRNFYVITSNAITNFGSSKNVEFLARASAETGGVKP